MVIGNFRANSTFLFVGKAITPEVDFSETGPIGDTIGGIMNPFIALVGILLTFLASLLVFGFR